MKYVWLLFISFMGIPASAHEMTPTYFELKPAVIADGVLFTTIKLFNRREDVRYYEIEVYDSEFKHIPFAATSRVVKIDYLARKSVDVYIRKIDKDKVSYICTLSKLEKESITSGAISSRICSKLKEE